MEEENMWPFKKKETKLIPVNEENKQFIVPKIIRKTHTKVKTSRVIGLAAIIGHGGEGVGEDSINFLNECQENYSLLNPGLKKTIPQSDFLIAFSPSHQNINDMVFSFMNSPQTQRFGKTSKIIQVGLMSSFSEDKGVYKVPTAFVTFFSIDKKESESIEVVDFVIDSIKFV